MKYRIKQKTLSFAAPGRYSIEKEQYKKLGLKTGPPKRQHS